jgi:hypothetical protein
VLDDEKYKLTEQLDKESTDRRLTLKELRDNTQNELKQIEAYAQDFHQKAIEEFNHVATNLEKEMHNRFEHQDKIVDNLSNIVKTI